MDATPPEETESRLDRLVTLRSRQESALGDGLPARDFSTLSREYRATLAEIEELTPKKQVGDGIDEIAARRTARRASTAKAPRNSKRSG